MATFEGAMLGENAGFKLGQLVEVVDGLIVGETVIGTFDGEFEGTIVGTKVWVTVGS